MFGDKNTVKLAIPSTGRLAAESLERLAACGIVQQDWADNMAEALQSIKKRETESGVMQELIERDIYLDRILDNPEGLTVKYDLRSRWRAAFSAVDSQLTGEYKMTKVRERTPIKVNGTPVLIYGSEPPTINGIRQSLAELAIIGFDDLVAAMIPYFRRNAVVTDWSGLNKAISFRKSTDVRVIGSAGMKDYAGVFLLASEQWKEESGFLEKIASGKIPVYVKGRNEGLAYYLLGKKADARSTEEVEKAIISENCFGLDIVRTGTTVLERQLTMIGNPLLITMGVLAVDIAKYNAVKGVREVAARILPQDSTYDSREGIPNWMAQLEQKTGSSWRKK